VSQRASVMSRHEAQRLGEELTERQQRVLRGVYDGLTNKEIADRLGVSESAVKATLQQLFRKGHVRTRVQLIRIVIDGSLGWLFRSLDVQPR